MTSKLIDKNGNVVEGPITMIDVCDRCGNTTPFVHGMTVYSIPKDVDETEVGKTYCSEWCVRKVIEEKGMRVINV